MYEKDYLAYQLLLLWEIGAIFAGHRLRLI